MFKATLKSDKEYKKIRQDSLLAMEKALKRNGIKYEIREHPSGGQVTMDLLGYCPSGRWQILAEYKGSTFSIIRGLISFGQYEIYNVGGRVRKGAKKGLTRKEKFKYPARFSSPQKLIDELIKKD